jgi:hypothetical protein
LNTPLDRIIDPRIEINEFNLGVFKGRDGFFIYAAEKTIPVYVTLRP